MPANHPADAPAIFSAYAPQADVGQLTAMLKSHTDHHHNVVSQADYAQAEPCATHRRPSRRVLHRAALTKW